MKKMIKLIPLAAMLAAMALMLCSCKALDEKKLNHGIFTNADKTTLEYRGETYVYVMNAKEDGGLGNSIFFLNDEDMAIGYATEEDVPVLLASTFGEEIYGKVENGKAPVFLSLYSHTNEKVKEPSLAYFCREDLAPSFQKIISSVKIDQLYLDNYELEPAMGEYGWMHELIDDETKAVIEKTISRSFNPVTDQKDFKDIKNVSEQCLNLNRCDKDLQFTDRNTVQIIKTSGESNSYYIAASDSWLSMDYYNSGALKNVIWYRVADSDVPQIDALFRKYSENLDYLYLDD